MPRCRGATYYGPETFVSVKPFVSLDAVAPASNWGSFWLDLSGSVRPDRLPDAAGFKVSNRNRTKVIPVGRSGTNFQYKLMRDTLKTMTGSTALDTFTVVAYGVFGTDTLFGAPATVTNAPVITMTQAGKTATSVSFKIAFQPWTSSTLVYLRQWDPSSGKWTRVTDCREECNATGLSAGTYSFRADLINDGSTLFDTPGQTVTLP